MKRALFTTFFGVLILGLGQLSAQKSNIGINLAEPCPRVISQTLPALALAVTFRTIIISTTNLIWEWKLGLRSFPADPGDGTFSIIPYN